MPWSDDDVRYESALQEVCELCLEMEYHKRHFRIATYEEKSLRDRLDEQAFGCGAGRGRFCVDPCGDLYGCSKLATILGSGKGVLPMGNVFQGFTAVQNRMALLVTDAGPGQVRRVRVEAACAGGCPAVNAAGGSTSSPATTFPASFPLSPFGLTITFAVGTTASSDRIGASGPPEINAAGGGVSVPA